MRDKDDTPSGLWQTTVANITYAYLRGRVYAFGNSTGFMSSATLEEDLAWADDSRDIEDLLVCELQLQ